MNTEKLFFDLIRVSIGQQVSLSHTPSADEWGELYAMAKKQSLVGVCFAGVQRLVWQQQEPPEMLYLTWMGMAAKIQQRNEIVNRQCIELQAKLSADGLRSCILKGQGVAALYKVSGFNEFQVSSDLSLLRQGGDIDVWIEGGRKKVVDYVQQIAPTDDIRDNHAALDIFDNTEVEAHFRPATLRNPIRNKKLQKFFERTSNDCFAHEIDLAGGKINVPTTEFNMVYQLVHIFEHFYTEGVGMRQVMDYYMVLRTVSSFDSATSTSLSTSQEPSFKFQVVSRVQEVVKSLGLERFASALMWVIGYVFEGKTNLITAEGAESLKPSETASWMLWKPNEADGRMLLNEIMLSGNFGKQDERQKKMYESKWNSFWMVHFKTLRFWRLDHWAWFWSPLWRVFGFAVRKVNGYQ